MYNQQPRKHHTTETKLNSVPWSQKYPKLTSSSKFSPTWTDFWRVGWYILGSNDVTLYCTGQHPSLVMINPD